MDFLIKFEWDPAKARLNLSKHGVSFETATQVFEDALSVTLPDPDHSLGEHRLITIGHGLDGRLMLVSHTERGDTIRIISARRATNNERKRYET